MEILKRKPRTDLAFDSIIYKATGLLERAQAEGINEIAVDVHFTAFARVSSRVIFEEGEVDFLPALPTDDRETILNKYDAYLDSECIEAIERAKRGITLLDNPAPLEFSPSVGALDPKGESAATSGKKKSGSTSIGA